MTAGSFKFVSLTLYLCVLAFEGICSLYMMYLAAQYIGVCMYVCTSKRVGWADGQSDRLMGFLRLMG